MIVLCIVPLRRRWIECVAVPLDSRSVGGPSWLPTQGLFSYIPGSRENLCSKKNISNNLADQLSGEQVYDDITHRTDHRFPRHDLLVVDLSG